MVKDVEVNLFLYLVSTLKEPIGATKPYFDQLIGAEESQSTYHQRN